MSTIKLGPSGTETTLPTISWLGDSPPDLPVIAYKQIEEAKMSDGSLRWAFFQKKREWRLEWGLLTAAELATIEGLYDLNQVLHYQNTYESTTWYDVVFTSFEYRHRIVERPTLDRYWCQIGLRQA